MTELTYMRETCTSSEFYDGLALLCVKFGAVVVLTIIAGAGERAAVLEQLRRRRLEARIHGAEWQIFESEEATCRTHQAPSSSSRT